MRKVSVYQTGRYSSGANKFIILTVPATRHGMPRSVSGETHEWPEGSEGKVQAGAYVGISGESRVGQGQWFRLG